MLFNELRLHGKHVNDIRCTKRIKSANTSCMRPLFFWGAYFMFIGIGLAKAISTVPNMGKPYHILNSGPILPLALDFVIRFPHSKKLLHKK